MMSLRDLGISVLALSVAALAVTFGEAVLRWTWPAGPSFITLLWIYLSSRNKPGPWRKAATDVSFGLLIGIGFALSLWMFVRFGGWSGSDAARNVAGIEIWLLDLHNVLKTAKKAIEFPWVFLTVAALLFIQYYVCKREIVAYFFEKPSKWLSTAALAAFAATSFTYFGHSATSQVFTKEYEAKQLEVVTLDEQARRGLLEAIAAGILSGGTQEGAGDASEQRDREYLTELLLTTDSASLDQTQQDAIIASIVFNTFEPPVNRARALSVGSSWTRQFQTVLQETPSGGRPISPQGDGGKPQEFTRAQRIREQAITGLREAISKSVSSVIPEGRNISDQLLEKYAKKLSSEFAKKFLKEASGQARLSRLVDATEKTLNWSGTKLADLRSPKAPADGQGLRMAATMFIRANTPPPSPPGPPDPPKPGWCTCVTTQKGVPVSWTEIPPGATCGLQICGRDKELK
jgi:hypothetical protein